MNLLTIINALSLLLSPEQVNSQPVQDIAVAIAAANPSREQAALMITGAWHESHFVPEIIAGGCDKHGCDDGKARGIWQLHRAACPKAYEFEAGSAESILLEAACARSLYGWAYRECRTVPGAFAFLGGLACNRHEKFVVRQATYDRVLRSIK